MSGIWVHNVKIPRNLMLKKKTKKDRFRNGKKDISLVSKVLGTLRPLPGGVEVPAWWWWLTLALDAELSPGNLFRAALHSRGAGAWLSPTPFRPLLLPRVHHFA